MNRRRFLAALAAVPFVRRFVPERETAPLIQEEPTPREGITIVIDEPVGISPEVRDLLAEVERVRRLEARVGPSTLTTGERVTTQRASESREAFVARHFGGEQ